MRFYFINKFIFRIVICLIVVTVLMLFSIVRVADISLNTKTVNATSNGYTVELNDGRGNIYDCNSVKLTGSEELYAIVFLPCEEAMVKFVQITSGTKRENGQKKSRRLLKEKINWKVKEFTHIRFLNGIQMNTVQSILSAIPMIQIKV